jgi:hypothetical protein
MANTYDDHSHKIPNLSLVSHPKDTRVLDRYRARQRRRIKTVVLLLFPILSIRRSKSLISFVMDALHIVEDRTGCVGGINWMFGSGEEVAVSDDRPV